MASDKTKDYIAKYSEIQRKTFLQEGYALALPMCFPGDSVSIDPDESRINDLILASDNSIYGVTDGEKAHLFGAMTRDVTGFVFDMGLIPGKGTATAVVDGIKDVFVCRGSAIYRHEKLMPPFDCLQEWFIDRAPFADDCLSVDSGSILHAVGIEGNVLAGITASELFIADMSGKKSRILYTDKLDSGNSGHLLKTEDGIAGVNKKGVLWTFSIGNKKFEKNDLGLKGEERACLCVSGGRILIGAGNRIISFDPRNRTSGLLAELPLAPLTTLAAMSDGRICATSGKEIEHLFEVDVPTAIMRDLGVFVSVLAARRYGYNFRTSLVGSQGELILGEYDRGAHLWLYFPKIRKTEKG